MKCPVCNGKVNIKSVCGFCLNKLDNTKKKKVRKKVLIKSNNKNFYCCKRIKEILG